MKYSTAILLPLLLSLKSSSCQFHTRYKKWPKAVDLTRTCNEDMGTCTTDPECDYAIQGLGQVPNFGAQITGLNLKTLSQACADKLIQDAFMFRFLIFPDQVDLSWEDEIAFTEKMGEGQAFPETTSANRKFHPKVPDPRLGYFSNDPDEGLMYQGTEGWHVDGNTVELPHTFTIIHCIAANKNGPTLLVPLKEIVERLSPEERLFLEPIYFVSAHNHSIIHPLLYKHPFRHDDTVMLALGSLSGQYLRSKGHEFLTLSKAETQHIQDILEAKILGSNLIYTHQWQKGDLLVLNNPSLAHIAGPGSQGSHQVTGLRLMHRLTVAGKVRPSKFTSQASIPLKYHCFNHPPFESREYCLFSLKESLFYPRYGEFESIEAQRKRCQNVHAQADLALVPNGIWNKEAGKIVSHHGVPHFINATNPEGTRVEWNTPEGIDSSSWTFTDWHQPSGQPNDCVVKETCIFIGPNAKVFFSTFT